MYIGNSKATTEKTCKRSIILMLKEEIKWNHAQLKPEKAGKDTKRNNK